MLRNVAQRTSLVAVAIVAFSTMLACTEHRPQSDATDYMGEAMKLAREAAQDGNTPVGAVLVHEGRILARARNRVLPGRPMQVHAEELLIEEVHRQLGADFLRKHASELRVYVTYEPCKVCAARLIHQGITHVVYAERKAFNWQRDLDWIQYYLNRSRAPEYAAESRALMDARPRAR